MIAAGVPAERAESLAEVLLYADMLGIHSHGVMRIARYIECIRSGGIHPLAPLQILEESPCMMRVSANGGLGIPASCEVIRRLIKKAGSQALAAASVSHSDHYGAAGYYALKLAENGLIGFSMSNTCPLIAVTGAAAAGIGNNPFAYAAPAGRYRAVLFDVCMSVVASGKIQLAADNGKPIPEGWILDCTGKPTTDPKEIYNGAIMLPFAQHKGYGFAVMVELLSGVLSGAGILDGVHSWNMIPGEDANTGHFFLAINPKFFGGLETFVSRTEEMIDKLHSAPTLEGVKQIYYPGELEFQSEARALKDGIDLPQSAGEALAKAAAAVGIQI